MLSFFVFTLDSRADRDNDQKFSLFAEGCPIPGRSLAKKITDPGLRMRGPDALGGAGDYLIMNDRAAFIIEGLEQINTYYYYGGILIDAAALDGCTQINPEQFEELGFFVGRASDVNVRAFKGERIEVLDDGADRGPAIVRVHGSDQVFWIAELQLIRLAYGTLGLYKPRSEPFGLDLYVDYILPPDSPVLIIELNLKNRDPEHKHLFTAAGGFFGDATQNRYFSEGMMPLAFFSADLGLPGLISSSGEGAWAVGMKNSPLGTANLSGFDAIFNIKQLRRRLELAPAGEPGDSAKATIYFAVGASDFNSALSNLAEVNPQPFPGWDFKLKPFSGKVIDQKTGAPLAGVKIELEVRNRSGQWRFYTGFVSDGQGEFGGLVPDPGRKYRLTASLNGWPDLEPVYFKLADRPRVEIAFSPAGRLAYEILDHDGRALPAKIGLYQGGELVRTIYCRTGLGELEVEPGAYEVSVTRGYEYIPYEGELEIGPGKTAKLEAVLAHAVNTDGFLSVDMHLHAGPSGDNKITIAERIETVAAEGLEVAVSTDHEAIISWQPGVFETGLGDWVAVVTGEEVTATVPEHINAFPFEPRFDLDARGGPVRWHGLDIAEVYAAIRERGASIVQLNHPLEYFELIEYDLATGEARLEHPENLGLPPGAALWSWDLDSFEYQNGNDPVFRGQRHRGKPGTFDYWMSFVNLGHRITAVANTDAHDYTPPGMPRNYFPSSTDRPAEFQVEELIRAVKEGRVLASTGAFARVKVNDQAEMGDTIAVSEDYVDLYLHIESIPQIDVTHFKVFVNCDEVMNVKLADTDEVVKYDGHLRVPIAGDSQIVVLGFGKKKLPRGFRQFDPLGVPRFTVNPIYVDRDGDGWSPPGFDGCNYRLP